MSMPRWVVVGGEEGIGEREGRGSSHSRPELLMRQIWPHLRLHFSN